MRSRVQTPSETPVCIIFQSVRGADGADDEERREEHGREREDGVGGEGVNFPLLLRLKFISQSQVFAYFSAPSATLLLKILVTALPPHSLQVGQAFIKGVVFASYEVSSQKRCSDRTSRHVRSPPFPMVLNCVLLPATAAAIYPCGVCLGAPHVRAASYGPSPTGVSAAARGSTRSGPRGAWCGGAPSRCRGFWRGETAHLSIRSPAPSLKHLSPRDLALLPLL